MLSAAMSLVRHDGDRGTHTLVLETEEERKIACDQFQAGDLNFRKLVQSIAAYRARFGVPRAEGK